MQIVPFVATIATPIDDAYSMKIKCMHIMLSAHVYD